MSIKGFTGDNNNIETPSDVVDSEKPLISRKNKSNRVDINILKSKLEEQQSREFKKNLTIFSFFVFLLCAIGSICHFKFVCQKVQIMVNSPNEKFKQRIKKKLISKYMETNTPKVSSKSTDINVLLNRVKFDRKQEIKKKFYFSAAASTGLILFGIIVFS